VPLLEETLRDHTESVESVAVSKDKQFIVSGDRNGVIIVWDFKTRKVGRWMFHQ